MSAETAEHVGIQKLKQFHMVNIDMFRHPKYYKELRRAGVQVNSSRPAHSRCNKSDQAISSLDSREVVDSVRPGPGLKRQASSNKLREIQASSGKHQAPSTKVQAPSRKRQAPGPWILEKVSW